MKTLFDTSMLVAAHLPTHPNYAAASAWLSGAKRGSFDLHVAAHSLAETYSVLTRLPVTPRISPSTAWQFLEQNVLSCADVVALTRDDYVHVVRLASRQHLAGGVIYDALIARVAENLDVDHLLTLNVTDFQRVWPAGASRIASPHALSPPPPPTAD